MMIRLFLIGSSDHGLKFFCPNTLIKFGKVILSLFFSSNDVPVFCQDSSYNIHKRYRKGITCFENAQNRKYLTSRASDKRGIEDNSKIIFLISR